MKSEKGEALNNFEEGLGLFWRLLKQGGITPKRITNLVRNYIYDALKVSKSENSFPNGLIVEPANFCNVRCTGCGLTLGGQVRKARCMKLDEFKSLIDDVGEYIFIVALHNGGEPFLNKDCLKMARYCYDNKIAVNLSTNADFKTPDDWGEQICESGVDTMIFSISGIDNESHAEYHVDGNYDRVYENMKKVTAALEKHPKGKHRPVMILRHIKHEGNKHLDDKVRALCRELKFDKLDIRATETFQMVYKKKDDGTPLKFHQHQVEPPPNHCHTAWYIPSVLATGDVMPCCFYFFFPPSPGNAFTDGGLRKLWQSKKYKSFKQALLTDRSAIPGCDVCPSGKKVGFQGANFADMSTIFIDVPADMYEKGAQVPAHIRSGEDVPQDWIPKKDQIENAQNAIDLT